MPSLTELTEIIGFFSYSREDDEDSDGSLSKLRLRIQNELRAQLGRPRETLRLWQDQEAIPPGTLWEAQIQAAVDQSCFFIPIITPRVVSSKYCGVELHKFIERETKLDRNDLVFPILYIGVRELQNELLWRADPVLSIIGERQYVDWQEFRYEPDSPVARRAVASLCVEIAAALGRAAEPSRARPDASLKALRDAETTARERAEARARLEEEARARAVALERQQQADKDELRLAEERRLVEEKQRFAEERKLGEERRLAEERKQSEDKGLERKLAEERTLAEEGEQRRRKTPPAEEAPHETVGPGPLILGPRFGPPRFSSPRRAAVEWAGISFAVALFLNALRAFWLADGLPSTASLELLQGLNAIVVALALGVMVWRSGLAPWRASAIAALKGLLGLLLLLLSPLAYAAGVSHALADAVVYIVATWVSLAVLATLDPRFRAANVYLKIAPAWTCAAIAVVLAVNILSVTRVALVAAALILQVVLYASLGFWVASKPVAPDGLSPAR